MTWASQKLGTAKLPAAFIDSGRPVETWRLFAGNMERTVEPEEFQDAVSAFQVMSTATGTRVDGRNHAGS